MTYAEMVVQRNGIWVRVEDSCSPDSPDLDVCPNPKPGPRLMRLARILADQRTVDLPKGHRFKVSVIRTRSTMSGRTSSTITILCEGCDSRVETGPIRLNLDWSDDLLAHHLSATWKMFERSDFGSSCKDARRLRKVRALMDR